MIFANETDIKEQTDLAEVLKQLNLDSIDKDTGMSDIDMRSRLGSLEIPAILQLDALVGMNVLPQNCLSLTRQKKRLAVSLYGQGRKEIVKIATSRDDDSKDGFIKNNSPIGLLKKKDSLKS